MLLIEGNKMDNYTEMTLELLQGLINHGVLIVSNKNQDRLLPIKSVRIGKNSGDIEKLYILEV